MDRGPRQNRSLNLAAQEEDWPQPRRGRSLAYDRRVQQAGWNRTMNSGDEQAGRARQLLAGTFNGVFSTHSLEYPGYPFGSVVPYMLDREGLPLLLLSHLSQHTKNIDDDPRCGLTVIEAGDGDIQQRGRLSAVGDTRPVDAGADVERYFDYFPQSRMYHDELGFRFYRFRPERFHWNGGFATARWFSVGRIVRANPFDAAVEARIREHMNRDHRDALAGYLAAIGPVAQDDVVMAGMDAEGLDLRAGERLYRLALPREVRTPEEARQVLVEMAAVR
jgi:putative heme iron utilization protein